MTALLPLTVIDAALAPLGIHLQQGKWCIPPVCTLHLAPCPLWGMDVSIPSLPNGAPSDLVWVLYNPCV